MTQSGWEHPGARHIKHHPGSPEAVGGPRRGEAVSRREERLAGGAAAGRKGFVLCGDRSRVSANRTTHPREINPVLSQSINPDCSLPSHGLQMGL